MSGHFSSRVWSFLQMPKSAGVVILASVAALLFAFIIQYGFDIHPCVLCLWQRVPFGLVIALGITACIWRPYGIRAQVLLGLCALAFFANTGLAIFHTGVEQHWWTGTRGCAITPLHGKSVSDWKAELMTTVLGHCDQVSWTFLNLSMANWNIPFSTALGLFASFASLRQGKKVTG